MKLKEEEQRAVRYLETRKNCDSVLVVSEALLCATFDHFYLRCMPIRVKHFK